MVPGCWQQSARQNTHSQITSLAKKKNYLWQICNAPRGLFTSSQTRHQDRGATMMDATLTVWPNNTNTTGRKPWCCLLLWCAKNCPDNTINGWKIAQNSGVSQFCHPKTLETQRLPKFREWTIIFSDNTYTTMKSWGCPKFQNVRLAHISIDSTALMSRVWSLELILPLNNITKKEIITIIGIGLKDFIP